MFMYLVLYNLYAHSYLCLYAYYMYVSFNLILKWNNVTTPNYPRDSSSISDVMDCPLDDNYRYGILILFV